MTTIADSALIYALGGGRGHAQRAAVLARRFERALILHQSPDPPQVSASSRLVRVGPEVSIASLHAMMQACAARVLVVDSFPAGVAGEIDRSIRDRFARTVLVRRFVKPGSYPDYERHAACYDEHWLPYHPDGCEWDGAPGSYLGPCVRQLRAAPGEPTELAVIGDTAQLPPAWRRAFPAGAIFINDAFDSLPPARKYLCVGAGHNISYELEALGVDAALLPLERRYDDQFRRADRLGLAVHRRSELHAFLGG